MNFEEWLKEMSKGAFFPGDDEDSDVVERVNSFSYEDSEEEDPKNPNVNWTSK